MGDRQSKISVAAELPVGAGTRFRKRPLEVDAMQYDGTNFVALWAFTGKSAHIREVSEMHAPLVLAVYTREGAMKASVGDWIIRGVHGEFYPCKPDIFAETYDPVPTDEPCSSPSSSFLSVGDGETP